MDGFLYDTSLRHERVNIFYFFEIGKKERKNKRVHTAQVILE